MFPGKEKPPQEAAKLGVVLGGKVNRPNAYIEGAESSSHAALHDRLSGGRQAVRSLSVQHFIICCFSLVFDEKPCKLCPHKGGQTEGPALRCS
jgi:hypothetical protein